MLNADQLNSVNLAEVKQATFHIIDVLQSYDPAVQPVAAALLMVELCEKYGVRAQKVLEVVSRVRKHADDSMDRTQLSAVRVYVQEEIKNG